MKKTLLFIGLLILIFTVGCTQKTAVDDMDFDLENAEKVIACQAGYKPVCGINGNTYANTCTASLLFEEQIAYEGECGNQQKKDSIVKKECPEEDYPVCGADGITYPNICSVGSIEVMYEAACEEEDSYALGCRNVTVIGEDITQGFSKYFNSDCDVPEGMVIMLPSEE